MRIGVTEHDWSSRDVQRIMHGLDRSMRQINDHS
jgi:hypothetical protein